ncbi:TPA_asm: oncoid [Bos-associated insect adintovirus]|uniref:Oncoid n=1 Tax=Bos-associated insect adintovirus TaxID=2597806 RepID=A0A5H3CJ80_9VIRU|nr:TPA_asm: oncoid [Bos-associated insect adintovirus]
MLCIVRLFKSETDSLYTSLTIFGNTFSWNIWRYLLLTTSSSSIASATWHNLLFPISKSPPVVKENPTPGGPLTTLRLGELRPNLLTGMFDLKLTRYGVTQLYLLL